MDLNDTIDPSYSMAEDDHNKPVPMNQTPPTQQPTHRQKQIYDLLNVAEEQQETVAKLIKEFNQVREENIMLNSQLRDAIRVAPQQIEKAIKDATVEKLEADTRHVETRLNTASHRLDKANEKLTWKLAATQWLPLVLGSVMLAGWAIYNIKTEQEHREKMNYFQSRGADIDFIKCGDSTCVSVDPQRGLDHNGKKYFLAK